MISRLKESDITEQVRGVLERCGALPLKIWGGGSRKLGISDLLVFMNGRFIAIDVDKPGGKLSETQKRFMEEVETHRGLCSSPPILRT